MPGQATFRTVPSAGARHALETYLLINNVEGLPPGLYRYLAREHSLQEVNQDPDIATSITQACLNQNSCAHQRCNLLLDRVCTQGGLALQGDGVHPPLLLDAGRVCQNLWPPKPFIAVCAPSGHLWVAEMNRTPGLDGEEQELLHLAAMGWKWRAEELVPGEEKGIRWISVINCMNGPVRPAAKTLPQPAFVGHKTYITAMSIASTEA